MRNKSKLLAVFFAAVLLLGLAGCQPSDPGSGPIAAGQTYTDLEGIGVQIANTVWSDDGATLEVKWINNTKYDAIYGASYHIERLEDGQWISCAKTGDLNFIEIACELKAGQVRTEIYKLFEKFNVSQRGTYRFRSECYVHTGAEESEKSTLWAEFTVGGNASDGTGSTALEYGVQYIRTDGYVEGAQFPRVYIIRSREELNDYYERNRDTFDLERNPDPGADSTIGFLDACDRYDDSFFESKYLIFVLLEEGSGSTRHAVKGIAQTSAKQIAVSIDTITPGVGTCDMAEWHVILELSRGTEESAVSDVLVYLDGK